VSFVFGLSGFSRLWRKELCWFSEVVSFQPVISPFLRQGEEDWNWSMRLELPDLCQASRKWQMCVDSVDKSGGLPFPQWLRASQSFLPWLSFDFPPLILTGKDRSSLQFLLLALSPLLYENLPTLLFFYPPCLGSNRRAFFLFFPDYLSIDSFFAHHLGACFGIRSTF